MPRARAYAALWIAVAAAGAMWACSSFGDEDETPPPLEDASSDVIVGELDGGDANEPCVPETPYAQPEGGVPINATCNGITGVNLLTSDEHCGKCGRSCLPERCVDGECAPHDERAVVDLPAGAAEGAHVLGKIGDAIYFREGWYRLVVRRGTGTFEVVHDFGVPEAGAPFIFGGVGGTPGNTFVRTRGKLYRVGNSGLAPVADLFDNDRPDDVGVVPGEVIIVNKSELQRVTIASGVVLPAIPAPNSLYVVAQDNAAFWLEMPWNKDVGGGPGNDTTRLRKILGGTNALVTTFQHQVISLKAFSGGFLYFMQLGPGGGIFRLPAGATDKTPPELFAPDDQLGGRYADLAEDATHIYWTRSWRANDDRYAELWKRAKCGGVSVRLQERLFFGEGLAIVGKRIYIGTNGALVSLPK